MMTQPSRGPEAEYRRYGVSGAGRQPLVRFMMEALQDAGCSILFPPDYSSTPSEAPFRITFETPEGERMGIIAYAFTANMKPTKNRPSDEHRFQIKYGSKRDGLPHDLWQDPYSLYTTLLVGIDPERQIFVGADPVLHSPTRFFISVEFKASHVEQILANGWHVWERERRSATLLPEPVEVLVGGTKSSFLRYVRFEREALREDQGHRQLLAEKVATETGSRLLAGSLASQGARVHELSVEFELSEREVLDLIAENRRLKMAVRGWVAEHHLYRWLRTVPGVTDCQQIRDEGRPDVQLRFRGSPIMTVECKNVLRNTVAGLPRMDFQRTRTSIGNPCSRYYSPSDFDVVAACLHAVTEQWEFRFAIPSDLNLHPKCDGKLSNLVRIDSSWESDIQDVLSAAASRASNA